MKPPEGILQLLETTIMSRIKEEIHDEIERQLKYFYEKLIMEFGNKEK